jgi:hypothetical protein
MRYLFGFLCVCALSVVPLVGCSEATRTCQSHEDCDDGRECSAEYCIDGLCRNDLTLCPCEAPLSDYCSGSDCPTWDQLIVDVLESCPEVQFAEAGRCGDSQYVERSRPTYRSPIEYFDASGILVAVRICSDADEFQCAPGHTAFCIEYGLVPDCERKPEKVLCGGLCEVGLSDYCSASECLTWNEATADVRKLCDTLSHADTGRCGDYAYIRVRSTDAFSHRYFDDSGALVAVRWCTNSNTIECAPDHFARCKHYGPVPGCERELEEVLCE